MGKKKESNVGFIISIVVLIAGMSIGFILLSFVYTGPNWVKFIVFLVYITIVYFLIRFSIAFVRSSTKANNEVKDR